MGGTAGPDKTVFLFRSKASDTAPESDLVQNGQIIIWCVMQRLFGLVIALALMIVPLSMISGSGAAHADQTQVTAAPSGCHEDKGTEKKKGVGMSAECALACAALPAAPARVEAQLVISPPSHPAIMLAGVTLAGPESSDPPPRA